MAAWSAQFGSISTDDYACAKTPHGLCASLADIAVSADNGRFAGNHHIGLPV
jgi:hypothetical protein